METMVNEDTNLFMEYVVRSHNQEDIFNIGRIAYLLDRLGVKDEVMANVTEPLYSVDEYATREEIRDMIKQSMLSNIKEHIIVPKLNIILEDKPFSYGFIYAVLEVLTYLKETNPVINLAMLDMLSAEEFEPEHKLGMCINLFYPEYAPTDAYDDISHLDEATISSYISDIEEVVAEHKEDPVEVADLFQKLNKIDVDLLHTKLFNYVVTHGLYDITIKGAVVYINTLINKGLVNEISLSRELVTMAVIVRLSLDEVIEIIDDICEEYDTVSIVNYVSEKLRGISYG